MLAKRIGTLVGTAFLLASLTGCFWAPELDRVRKDIERQIPDAHFEKDFAISLGPISLSLVRTLSRFVPEDDVHEAREYLGDLSKVQVAVYEADVPRGTELETPHKLESLLDEGWEMAIKAREHGESIWVMYRSDDDEIRDVYVIVLDPDELVLVKASGRLDRLFAKVMEEHGDLGELGIGGH